MATNKQIVDRLECIEARLPNGELQEMHTMIKEIKDGVKERHNELECKKEKNVNN